MTPNPRLDRRNLLTSTSATGLSAWLGTLMSRKANANPSTTSSAPFKRCITLWMQGGPSQLDTFDPKPGTPNGGPLQSIPTRVPGLSFCETLGKLATRADELCLIRNLGSNQGEHERASHLLHTGYEFISSFPRPSLGAHVSASQTITDVPGYVILGPTSYGPAYLGDQHGPFVIDDVRASSQMLERLQRRSDRIDLIGRFNGSGPSQNATADQQDRALQGRTRQIETVRRLLRSPFAGSLRIDDESPQTQARYGDHDFGRHALVARRMLEAGVRYVEIQMPGWDTHVGNFPAVRKLCAQLEPAWLALMDDLKSSGLWQDTLILWMGEFGRTPLINGQQGRDHYPQSIPVVLAGGPLGGRVIGSTGRDGSDPTGKQHHVADLFYTLMTLLGIDPEAQLTTGFGSPTSATDGGSLIDGLT